MAEQFANRAQTTLAAGADASQLTITVANGAVFPAAGTFRILVDTELMICTARTGNVLTVTRGAESTVAAAHGINAQVTSVLTAGVMVKVPLTDQANTFSALQTFGVGLESGAGGDIKHGQFGSFTSTVARVDFKVSGANHTILFPDRLQLVAGDAPAKLTFGSAEDTNLYRSAANVLKTDDQFVSKSGGADGATGLTVYGLPTNVPGIRSQPTVLVKYENETVAGSLGTPGQGYVGLNFTGPTTNSTGMLLTDTDLLINRAIGELANPIRLNPRGDVARGVLILSGGNIPTVDIFESAAQSADAFRVLNNSGTPLTSIGADGSFKMKDPGGTLRTMLSYGGGGIPQIGGGLQAGVEMSIFFPGGLNIAPDGTTRARIDSNGKFILDLADSGATRGIAFGSSADTNLYRAGPDFLATDDDFAVKGGDFYVQGVGVAAANAILHPVGAQDRQMTLTGDATSLIKGNYGLRVAGHGDSGPYLYFGSTVLGDAVGAQIINRTDAAATPLRVRGMAAQSGELQLWQDSSQNSLAAISPTGRLRLYGAGYIERIAPGYGGFFFTENSGDSNARFSADTNGYLAWGIGTAPEDTVLYRSAANVLKTDDSFYAVGTITSEGGLTDAFKLSGSTWKMDNTGVQTWSGDTNLYRWGANILATDDKLQVAVGTSAAPQEIALFHNANTSVGAAFVNAGNEAQLAFTWTGDGIRRVLVGVNAAGGQDGIGWYNPATQLVDTSLYRSAISELKTDSVFRSGAGMRSEAASSPSTGAGLELLYNAPTGIVQAFDRTGAAWKDVSIRGLTVDIRPSGGGAAASFATGGDTTLSGDVYFTKGTAALAHNGGAATSVFRLMTNQGGGLNERVRVRDTGLDLGASKLMWGAAFGTEDVTIERGAAWQVKVAPAGNAPTSTTTGGALLVESTLSNGAGIVAYSNHATPTGRLVSMEYANAAGGQTVLRVAQAGTTHGMTVDSTSTGANANALVVTSTNPNDTTLGVSGAEEGKGTIKVTHNKPTNPDTNASAISIQLAGASTAAQGIFMDSTGATTGKLLNLRNNGADRMVLTSVGLLQLDAAAAGATAGIQFAGEAASNLYRSAASTVRTDGSFTAATFRVSGSDIVNNASANNARLRLLTTGSEIDRNQADANPVLQVRQLNASGTGQLLTVRDSGTKVAEVHPRTSYDSSAGSTAIAMDVYGAVLRIGDADTVQTFTNGIGIKFHDAGSSHWSIKTVAGGGIGIGSSGASGDSLAFDAMATSAGESLRINTSNIADGDIALLVRRNVGGAASIVQVSMGAADSGGAGFKVLRVPN